MLEDSTAGKPHGLHPALRKQIGDDLAMHVSQPAVNAVVAEAADVLDAHASLTLDMARAQAIATKPLMSAPMRGSNGIIRTKY